MLTVVLALALMVTGSLAPLTEKVGGVIVIPCRMTGPVPVLEIVMSWVALAVPSGWLGKLNDVGLTLTTALDARPVAVSGTTSGLPVCWVSVYVQLNVFAESGTNIIEKVVVPLAAKVAGVWPDANGNSRHEDVMAVIVVLAVPVLVTVIVFEGEVRPT
jgi:hypothetical protein